jgi:hypothetical protein
VQVIARWKRHQMSAIAECTCLKFGASLRLSHTGTIISGYVIDDEAEDIVTNTPALVAAHINDLLGGQIGVDNLGSGMVDATSSRKNMLVTSARSSSEIDVFRRPSRGAVHCKPAAQIQECCSPVGQFFAEAARASWRLLRQAADIWPLCKLPRETNRSFILPEQIQCLVSLAFQPG